MEYVNTRRLKSIPEEQYFTQAIYYKTKSFAPYRPVITNDGWEHFAKSIRADDVILTGKGDDLIGNRKETFLAF
ncbi:MAG: hypothetical protein J6C37_12105 [Roseburia sp.]|nr:hypothetical protein [Roseburia sp.]